MSSIECEKCGTTCKRRGSRQRFCSECASLQKNKLQKKYRESNTEKTSAANLKWRRENRDYAIKQDQDRYQKMMREGGLSESQKKKRSESRLEKIAAETDDEKRERLKKAAERSRIHRKENPEKYREIARNRYYKDVEKSRKDARDRYAKDPISARISAGIRSSLSAVGGSKGGESWEKLVGYTAKDLRDHIEKQFERGMGWHNRHLWHLDHIQPQADFNYKSPDDAEFLACWSLSNLRPLWSGENQSKGPRRVLLL